jgi:hypothetical protein
MRMVVDEDFDQSAELLGYKLKSLGYKRVG